MVEKYIPGRVEFSSVSEGSGVVYNNGLSYKIFKINYWINK